MKEKWKEKIKSGKKWYWILGLLIILTAILSVSAVVNARADDSFSPELDDYNNLSWEVRERRALPTDSLRYKTIEWWIFPNDTRYTEWWETALLENDNTSRSDWAETGEDGPNGVPLSTFRETPLGEPDSQNLYWSRIDVDAEDFVDKVVEMIGVDNREAFREPVLVWANPVQTITYQGNQVTRAMFGGTRTDFECYNYPDIESAPWDFCQSSWPAVTAGVLADQYNKSVTLTFSYAPFSIKVVDSEGNRIEEFVNNFDDPFSRSGFVLYGETLSGIEAPEITGYAYEGYYYTDGRGQNLTNLKEGHPEAGNSRLTAADWCWYSSIPSLTRRPIRRHRNRRRERTLRACRRRM